MAGKATINPTDAQKIERHIGRLKTLKVAKEKAISNNNQTKADSIQAEIDRRRSELSVLKTEIDEAIGS